MFSMTIAGNVGKDAQLRRTQGGDAVLGFSVAIDQGKDKSGNKRESVWVSCSIWGKRAESLESYIKKGTKLVVTGRPGVNVYEGKGSLTLSVNDLTFMGGSQQRDDQREDDRGGYDAPPQDNHIDDEIPF
jgi:single-strand DNA-binding protein